MLTKGVPFSLSLPELCASSPGIDVFQIDKRYQDQQTAACVLGYLLEHGLAGLDQTALTEMLRFANAAAYLVTTKKGAIRSMPERAQVEGLLTQTE